MIDEIDIVARHVRPALAHITDRDLARYDSADWLQMSLSAPHRTCPSRLDRCDGAEAFGAFSVCAAGALAAIARLHGPATFQDLADLADRLEGHLDDLDSDRQHEDLIGSGRDTLRRQITAFTQAAKAAEIVLDRLAVSALRSVDRRVLMDLAGAATCVMAAVESSLSEAA